MSQNSRAVLTSEHGEGKGINAGTSNKQESAWFKALAPLSYTSPRLKYVFQILIAVYDIKGALQPYRQPLCDIALNQRINVQQRPNPRELVGVYVHTSYIVISLGQAKNPTAPASIIQELSSVLVSSDKVQREILLYSVIAHSIFVFGLFPCS